ncbi:MAG: sigma-70 family RNA polymerase sigma factor [Phycisphaerales bacterium]|nr:MAG: sigma-70 family RNA polymerase sigma factor [Phycisphaerales bacterium]
MTVLAGELRRGDEGAADRLFPIVYAELRALAADLLHGEKPGHTLQPTALVHEAYVRLVDQTKLNYQDRAHFIAFAARTMRRVLVDHARAKAARKRGRGWERVTLGSSVALTADPTVDLLALNDALTRLASLHERQAQIVDLRFFGGLSIEETAAVLGVGHATVEIDWQMARAWLRRELGDGETCR